MSENQTSGKVRKSYSSVKLRARRDKRSQEAAARQREYDALSIKDRLARAKSRRGDSKREIARLEKLLKTKKT